MQTPTSTQKPTTPPPAPAAAKPASSGQSPTAPAPQTQQARAPAATQTGYGAAGVKDGFETAVRRPPLPASQGDAFESAASTNPAAPTPTAAPTPAPTPTASPAPTTAPATGNGTAPTATGEPAQAAGSGTAPTTTTGEPAQAAGSGTAPTTTTGEPAPTTGTGEPAPTTEAAPAEPAKPDPADPTAGMTPEEKAAYDALPPEERARYDAVHAEAAGHSYDYNSVEGENVANSEASVQALRDVLTAGKFDEYLVVADAVADSPVAQRDLRDLLFRGELLKRSDMDGSTIVDNLAKLATADTLVGGVKNDGQILKDLLHDLDNPEEIAQGSGTEYCAGSEYAFLMAAGDPAEYARMMTGLATEGKVTMSPRWAELFGGEVREMEFNGTLNPDDPAGRTMTEQIFGKAFVNEAMGADSWLMRFVLPMMNNGIDGAQFKDQLNEFRMLGGGWDAMFMPPADDPNVTDAQRQEAQQVAQDVLKTASIDNPLYVNINGHWVTVVGYDEATGQVRYHDGNQNDGRRGAIKSASLDDFSQGLNSIVYLDRNVPEVPEYLQNEEWATDGGGGSSTGGMGGGDNN